MFVLAEGAAPLVDPGSADGVFSLLWLVIALPLLGAVVLLVGGPLSRGRLAKSGPLFGAVRPVLSFVLSLVLFLTLLGRDSNDRQVGQHLYTWFEAGGLKGGADPLYPPLSAPLL